MGNTVLLFARDPGGANAVWPLAGPLRDRGYTVLLFGKDAARGVYERNGLVSLAIPISGGTITREDIQTFLQKVRPDFIITGTSADDLTEKYIWSVAEKKGIPSFAILDHWVNYGVRFSPYGVADLAQYHADRTHPFQPTKILVMDDYAKQALIKDGIEHTRMIVTGHPYFEILLRSRNSPGKSDSVRNRHGIADSDFLLTFASEPISKVYDNNDPDKPYLGYTEKSIFLNLAAALEQSSRESDRKITCLIKLHPKEDAGAYDDILKHREGSTVRYLVDRESSPVDVIRSSQLICGMSSMLLIEAVIIGKPVISVQIGLKRENPFVLERRGVLKSIATHEELKQALQAAIQEGKLPVYDFPVIQDPIARVLHLVEEHLCRH